MTDELREYITDLGESVEEISAILVGPKSLGSRNRDDGLVRQVDRMDNRLGNVETEVSEIKDIVSNGGVKAKPPITLWVTMITTLGLVAIAVIQGMYG